MRHALWALVLLAPLAHVAAAPFGVDNAPLEATSAPASCAAPPVEALLGEGYVRLRWPAACDADGYRLHRGTLDAPLAPLVDVRLPGHIDVGVEPGQLYVYAVQPLGGPVGAPTVIGIPSA